MLLLYLELFRTIVKVIRSCLTLPPHGLYSPWNSPGQNPGVGSLSLLQGIFPTQGSNPGLPHGRWILYQLSHQGNARILEWVAYPISSRSSRPRNRTGVSCCCVNREEVHLRFLRVFFFFQSVSKSHSPFQEIVSLMTVLFLVFCSPIPHIFVNLHLELKHPLQLCLEGQASYHFFMLEHFYTLK